MLNPFDKIRSRKHGEDTVQGFVSWAVSSDKLGPRVHDVARQIQERRDISDAAFNYMIDQGCIRDFLLQKITLPDLQALLDDPDVKII